MKYMIMVSGSQQDYDAMAGRSSEKPTWSPEDIKAMYTHMGDINADLKESGELIDAQGLTDPAHARRVQYKDGSAVVTDGPYPESKEVLAGYWIVDCKSLDRATEIAARAAACPGPGGVIAGDAVDIRVIGEDPEA
ncbi:MAG: hypothetical protein HOQ05_00520 [Corynebacteriales bacterium]|nr:hypothetical protein [Mycobacteriales bacterium]